MDALPVRLLSENAKLPTRGTIGSAGYDLYAAAVQEIEAWGMAMIQTDIAVEIDPGYAGKLISRSGVVRRWNLTVEAGLIDSDYRGPIGVILANNSNRALRVDKGDRIAQLVLIKITTPPVVQISKSTATLRGSGGFGSTGMQ